MRLSKKMLLQGCIILLITFVCLEGAALLYIAATQGRFHYTTPVVQTSNSTYWTLPLTRLHPYFGYYSELADFPPVPGTPQAPQRDPDEALVGIFGGSVAMSFYLAQADTHVLRDALQALPRYAGKRVRIVNFSHSGYKQPQQLNVFNYYLANGLKLDAAILIDGLNEVGFNAVIMEHGMDISMPMSPVFSDLVRQCTGGDVVDPTVCRMMDAKHRAQRLQDAADRSPLALPHLLYAALAKHTRHEFWALSKSPRTESNTTSMVAVAEIPPLAAGANEPAAALERSVHTWRYCTLAMLQAARMAGVELFEFIQPNQYVPTNRTLTEQERLTAWKERSALHRSVPAGYVRILQELDGLRAQGLRVYDMTRVFDDETGPIYIDTCCHVNERGNQLQEAFIAATMVQALSQPSP